MKKEIHNKAIIICNLMNEYDYYLNSLEVTKIDDPLIEIAGLEITNRTLKSALLKAYKDWSKTQIEVIEKHITKELEQNNECRSN